MLRDKQYMQGLPILASATDSISPMRGASDVSLAPKLRVNLSSNIDTEEASLLASQLVELHSETDQLCECQCTYHAGSHSIEAAPIAKLDPSSIYTIFLRGGLIGGTLFADYQQSFKTMTVGPIRVVLCKEDTDDCFLVSLTRSLGLYAELVGAVVERAGSKQSTVAELYCTRDATRISIRDDADVSLLRDGDKIYFTLQPVVVATTTTGSEQKGASRFFSQEYIAQHWVSAASGYYAVTGKMSTEEENQLILDIVKAFEHVDHVDPAISCEEAQATLHRHTTRSPQPEPAPPPTVDPALTMSFIPPGLHACMRLNAGLLLTIAEQIVNPWLNGLAQEVPSLHVFSVAEIEAAMHRGDTALRAKV